MVNLAKNKFQNMTCETMMNLIQHHHQLPRLHMADSPGPLAGKRILGPFQDNGLCENIEPFGEPCTRRFAPKHVLYLLKRFHQQEERKFIFPQMMLNKSLKTHGQTHPKHTVILDKHGLEEHVFCFKMI
jgi:hypothetical protein